MSGAEVTVDDGVAAMAPGGAAVVDVSALSAPVAAAGTSGTSGASGASGAAASNASSLDGVVITASHVQFAYDPGTPILQDISFNVRRGEVLMVLGSNGCGKSTLMRVLLNELHRQAGSITICGTDVDSLGVKELARHVAMVFQDHNAPFPFDVLDVVKMGRAPYLPVLGRPSKEDIDLARDCLDTVGLLAYAQEPYTNLSGGQRQMVLIARALAQQTDLVLMDEPTSHLDYRNAAVVLNTAHRLASEQNKAVIMITHAPDQAFYYPSTVALMKEGRFCAYGPSEEVITSEALSDVYRMDIKVLESHDPETGQRYLTCRPLPQTAEVGR